MLKTTVLILLLTATAWANPFQDHLIKLLKEHGEKRVLQDTRGVGLPGQSARLQLKLYEATHDDDGWMVEMEVKIQASNTEIYEFVSGSGQSREKATTVCLLNFTASNFHVLYKAFLNPNDAHLDSINFGPKEHRRQLIAGDLVLLGKKPAAEIPSNLKSQIIASVKRHPFPAGPHTLKIVYSPSTQALVTLDSKKTATLEKSINELAWPTSNQPFMLKQFMVVK